MAAKFQRKEDYTPKVQAWVSAASDAWNIPEDELWQELFEEAKVLSKRPGSTSPPSGEALLNFPLPKAQ